MEVSPPAPHEISRLQLLASPLAKLRHLDLSHRISGATLGPISRSGAFSDVYKVRLRNPEETVVAKHLRFQLGTYMEGVFEKEIYVWSKFNHPNVARLLGYAFHSHDNSPFLVSPYMDGGSAWDYVNKNPKEDVFPLIVGIARGLHYMHSVDAIHSDLKGANVLVSNATSPPTAIVTDFGSSRIYNASQTLGRPTLGPKGTIPWMACELIFNEPNLVQRYSEASDVWSFGMTVYELLSRKRPYHDYHSEAQVLFAIWREELPKFEILEEKHFQLLKDICMKCWDHSPKERPTMCDVLHMLCHEERCCSRYETMRQGPVNCVRFSRDGEYIAVASGRSVLIYGPGNSETHSSELHLGPECDPVQSLCFSHDSSVIAILSANQIIWMWDTSDESPEPSPITGEGQQVTALAYDQAKGRFLVYVLADGRAVIHKTATRRAIDLQGSDASGIVVSVAVSHSGTMIATGHSDGAICFWDANNGHFIHRLQGLSRPVSSISFFPDGNQIIACADKSIKKWQVSEKGVCIGEVDLVGHSDKIMTFAITKEQGMKWGLSIGRGGVGIWNLLHGKFVGTLDKLIDNRTYHKDAVISVDYSPKGGVFATASQNEIKLWKYKLQGRSQSFQVDTLRRAVEEKLVEDSLPLMQ